MPILLATSHIPEPNPNRNARWSAPRLESPWGLLWEGLLGELWEEPSQGLQEEQQGVQQGVLQGEQLAGAVGAGVQGQAQQGTFSGSWAKRSL